MTVGDYGTGGDDNPYELDYEPEWAWDHGIPDEGEEDEDDDQEEM